MISAKLEKGLAIRRVKDFVEREFGANPKLSDTVNFVNSFLEESHAAYVRETMFSGFTDEQLRAEAQKRGLI